MDRRRNNKKTKSGAATKARQQPAPQETEDELQPATPLVVLLCMIGIPVALTLCFIGICGIFVLLDAEHQTKWYSHTPFGEKWRSITEKNPFTTTLFVNGGAVTAVFLGKRLYDHNKAVKVINASKDE